MDWKNLQKHLKTMNWVILLILAGTSALFMPPSFTGGVILGGFLAIANFHLLQHTICRAFSPQGPMKKGKFSVIVKYYLRLFAVGVIIYMLVKKSLVDPLGLVVGVSIIVFSIIGLGIHLALKTKTGEAV